MRSVQGVVRKKNRVLVEVDGDEIVNLKTGKTIAIAEQDGVYFVQHQDVATYWIQQ